MTGAGSATLAFVKEPSFMAAPDNPTYYSPGRNPTVEEAQLSRQLQRMREAGLVEAAESLAGNLEGALTVSHAMSADTHEHVRDIVFNDAGTGFVDGLVNSSRWYLGIDYIGGTTERVCKGCTPLDYSISYDQGTNAIRESLTMGYADEEQDTATTPSSVVGPTDGSDVPFHGATLDVDGASVTKLQSATLSISNISRFHRGASPIAQDAVIAVPQTTLDATAIYEGSEYLELAYGGTGATTTQASMDSVAGSLTFESEGSTVATYTLPKLKPDTYSWQDLVNAENDITDPVNYHVNGGISVA